MRRRLRHGLGLSCLISIPHVLWTPPAGGSPCFGRSMRTLQPGTALARGLFMRIAALFFCLLLMTGCDQAQTSPTAPVDAEFTLAPGQARRIEGEPLAISFVGVSGDSRCPADALCVLGGSATVAITVASGLLTRPYDLRTGDMKPVV